MEPEGPINTHDWRGEYDLESYFPTEDEFFDDYSIISLPQFFVLDAEGILKGIVVGPMTEEELKERVEELVGA